MRRKQYACSLADPDQGCRDSGAGAGQDRIRSQMNIATAYHGMRDEAAAERTSAEAMDLIVSVFGPGHRDIADMLYLRAAS